MQTISFNVPSISCSVCSSKIQDGLKALKGVQNVNVDLKTQNVSVGYEPSDVAPDQIRKKVMDLGYDVVQ